MGFALWCAHGKLHKGVDFGDFALLHSSKQVIKGRDLGVQLEVALEYETHILLKREDAILDPFMFQKFSSMVLYLTWTLDL